MSEKSKYVSKTHQFQFRLPVGMKQKLQELAEEDGRTVSNLVKTLVIRYIKEKEMESKNKKRA